MLQRKRMRMLVWTSLVFAVLLVPIVATMGLAQADREDAVQIFNRDVFVIVGSTLRNPTAETPPDARLYSVVGAALDRTWGEWQAAQASSTARVRGGNNPRTDVRIHLTGLVPGGVYSVFYGTLSPDSENPLCPNVERTLALTAFHADRQFPDASSFVADASGAASFRSRVNGDLLSAGQVFYSIVYHFDGRTYHPLPNRGEFFTQGENCRSSYGEDAMRHLIIFQKF